MAVIGMAVIGRAVTGRAVIGRAVTGRAQALAISALLLAVSVTSCASVTTTAPIAVSSGPTVADAGCGDTLREIVTKAQAEGSLTLIGLPTRWANYGLVIESFRDMYGIATVDLDPEASSAVMIEAAKRPVGAPDRPDVLDVGSSFTQQAIAAGVVVPYRTTNWPQIPDAMKDPDAYWVGSYYGIMSIATNTDLQPVAPATWADLKDPRYRGQVTMNGDPRQSGVGFGAVVAAALANGGSLADVRPGIEYFAELKRIGNLRIADMNNSGTLMDSAPVVLNWSYNVSQAPREDGAPAAPVTVTIPSDGEYAAYYTQSVVADAAHPCAARLWLEHITGDTGAMGFVNGLAIPARLAALEAFGLVSDELRAELPPPSILSTVTMANPTQLEQAQAQVDELWGPLVLGEK